MNHPPRQRAGQETGKPFVVPLRQMLGTDMLPRILTGVIGVPILLLLTYLGPPYFNLGANIAGVIGSFELAHMIRPAHHGLALLMVLSILTTTTAVWLNALPVALVVLAVFAVLIVLAMRREGVMTPRLYAYALGGAFYIGLSMSVFALVRSSENGLWWVLMLFANNWCTDSFALFGGRLFGKHKLAPTISPSKTVEGALVGLTMGFIGGMSVALLAGLPLHVALVANIAVALATETGDLIESLVKRNLHVKDSGSILPGHGGFLDRMDGTLLAAPTLFVVLALFG